MHFVVLLLSMQKYKEIYLNNSILSKQIKKKLIYNPQCEKLKK